MSIWTWGWTFVTNQCFSNLATWLNHLGPLNTNLNSQITPHTNKVRISGGGTQALGHFKAVDRVRTGDLN